MRRTPTTTIDHSRQTPRPRYGRRIAGLLGVVALAGCAEDCDVFGPLNDGWLVYCPLDDTDEEQTICFNQHMTGGYTVERGQLACVAAGEAWTFPLPFLFGPEEFSGEIVKVDGKNQTCLLAEHPHPVYQLDDETHNGYTCEFDSGSLVFQWQPGSTTEFYYWRICPTDPDWNPTQQEILDECAQSCQTYFDGVIANNGSGAQIVSGSCSPMVNPVSEWSTACLHPDVGGDSPYVIGALATYDDPLNSLSDTLAGSLTFDDASCLPDASCDVSIPRLVLDKDALSVVAVAEDLSTHSISLSDMSLTLLQPAHGSRDPRGGLVFPANSFQVELVAGSGSIDGIPIDEPTTIRAFIHEVVTGSVDPASGSIELQLDLDAFGGVLSFDITARP